ncbi:MAG: OmpA family protein [Clostridiales bacterium]|nr:OmpA family protein [Clostridiales bacterium]
MSKKHRGGPHEDHADESWLIPYCDLLTLLLALFVTLYAASNVDAEKYAQIEESFQNQIVNGAAMTFVPGISEGHPMPVASPDEGEAAAEMERASLEAIKDQLQQYLITNGLEAVVTTSIDDRGLIVSMNDAVLFDPGVAEIKPEYRDVLVKIGETINQLNNYIRVEGHTDNTPSNTQMYPTNWELSGGRAASVVRLFVDQAGIDPEKLSSAGYGEFRPIADNSTVAGKSRNRRVDIIIMDSRFNALEQQGASNEGIVQ